MIRSAPEVCRATTPRMTALFGVPRLTRTSDALGTSNRGPEPFQAKKQGVCDSLRDFSLVHTHEDTGVGRKPAPRVEHQGSTLSARKPSIGTAMRTHARVLAPVRLAPSKSGREPPPRPSDPTKTARSPAPHRSRGSAASARHQLGGLGVHDRFLLVCLMIVADEVQDAMGKEKANLVHE